MFSQASGQAGLDLTTIPDFPAEIRAPQGSVAVYRVSRFNLAEQRFILPVMK